MSMEIIMEGGEGQFDPQPTGLVGRNIISVKAGRVCNRIKCIS